MPNTVSSLRNTLLLCNIVAHCYSADHHTLGLRESKNIHDTDQYRLWYVSLTFAQWTTYSTCADEAIDENLGDGDPMGEHCVTEQRNGQRYMQTP